VTEQYSPSQKKKPTFKGLVSSLGLDEETTEKLNKMALSLSEKSLQKE